MDARGSTGVKSVAIRGERGSYNALVAVVLHVVECSYPG